MAEVVRCQMQELYQSGIHDVNPDTVAFSYVINAWAKSNDCGAPQRAEAILSMKQKE